LDAILQPTQLYEVASWGSIGSLLQANKTVERNIFENVFSL
jgi:hypothetical protein